MAKLTPRLKIKVFNQLKTSLCPCNSKQKYVLCCGKYHKGKLHAPTAETLMRSRFSAYVTKNIQYIYRTWSIDTRPPLYILRAENDQVFTQLEIISSENGQISDTTGTVEFIASYILGNSEQVHQHHEHSYFLKKQGKWEYVNELSKMTNT